MKKRILAAVLLSFARAVPAVGQQQPVPLFNTLQANPPAAGAPQAPSPDQVSPEPSAAGGQQVVPDQTVPPSQPAQVQPQPALPPPAVAGRDFCGQNVTAHPADPRSVPDRYRKFVGIFSDAAWNAQLCAALIVETVADDGTATITYVFGPLNAGDKTAGGVLHGTGIVKDGALLFQNSDGSQYAFQPFYTDLSGKWTTPQGQSYEAIFKRSF